MPTQFSLHSVAFILRQIPPHEFADDLSGRFVLLSAQEEKPISKIPLDAYAKARIFHNASVTGGYTSSQREAMALGWPVDNFLAGPGRQTPLVVVQRRNRGWGSKGLGGSLVDGVQGSAEGSPVEAGVETPGRGFRGAKAPDAGSRAAYVPGRDSTAKPLTMGGCREGAWRLHPDQ